ncbi:hypothetical protein PPL_01108 [Heterostelium album PN500]|uniref:Uncharacterized protein n=1 Tax=Heterostelium pallidum (strain ATCC 26659 / Pp 5 / PN500) TaxID=670386 RepID=D3AY49_HETP5|nr:hypothetical protein PPL_01108 [Heterostelium album PN500]EFA85876.1 hypothetical protein PPL_01108 [Heterostelium album PN500]|eukprot:XP_020437982.1 hypothetical protein PPL_01108 [Heterostelium album PN500]
MLTFYCRIKSCYGTPSIDISVVPKITSIENCPYQWIKFFKHLPCLKSFSTEDPIPEDFLEPGDFPNSLTRLDLKNFDSKLKPNVIPSTIKHLSLGYFDWELTSESIPKDAQFEHLCVCDTTSKILPDQLPPNIKSLELRKYNQLLEPGSIPFGIETLKLPSMNVEHIIKDVIPSSIKLLNCFKIQRWTIIF